MCIRQVAAVEAEQVSLITLCAYICLLLNTSLPEMSAASAFTGQLHCSVTKSISRLLETHRLKNLQH